jgi:ribonuclease J
MAHLATGGADLKYDSLAVVPLGGQSELGQVLWVLTYGGEILLVDCGAVYPAEDLPGVDLLLPNTNFLEANQERIRALLLTNGHEEHSGAVGYLLSHLNIPRIMAPRFVSALLSQSTVDKSSNDSGHNLSKIPHLPEIDTVETRHPYQIGPFEVEWIRVNDAIADACALRIATPEGTVVYTSSFKLDQTPVDKRLLDVSRLAQVGDNGVLLLISDSAGVEDQGYTPSERSVVGNLEKHINNSPGRVFVVVAGTNTHRLQLLFDIAKRTQRKVVLVGEPLIRTAVAAAITGNLSYDRKIEANLTDLNSLPDRQILVVATGMEGDPINILQDLAYGNTKSLTAKEGDTVIYSADIYTGRSRQMAMILDQFLSLGVKVIYGPRQGIHVSKHASQEELKLMLSIVQPKYFIPAFGEGRHIMHHAQLASQWGLSNSSIFPLKNGEILQIDNGIASIIGTIESQAVLFNRDQGERVTTYSVNERRVLSLEGVVTIGLVVSDTGELVSGPSIEVGASGFRQSPEWEQAKAELSTAIVESIEKFVAGLTDNRFDVNALRAHVRDITVKKLRSRLQAKPTVQVVLHELVTSRPQ